MNKHTVVFGDSKKLNKIKDKSVQLIITSPPYWQLKDYGTGNQIGFNESYESYINNLNLVWQECYRVLDDGCRMCINIGDQFARSVYYGRYKVIPIRTEIIRFCENIGMDYMGAIIWQKATTMNTTGGGSVMGSFPFPRNGILKIDYEFILIFKKLGNSPKPTKEQKEQSKLTKEEWDLYFASHWNFNGAKQDNHIAMFPEELPKRLIKMFSFVNETIFDPFLGSGTTSLAAKNLNRCSIGYEINSEYRSIIEEKLNFNQLNIINYEVEFLNDYLSDEDVGLSRLPYIYSDPHKLDKKIDSRLLTFGSKINGLEKETQELFLVKDVISPEELLLNNGLKIKLIGIKENPQKREQAIEYLTNKLNKRKIYLKYDKIKYQSDALLCYVYLDNRTFINNHLIRTGFVEVDNSFDYKYKQKFKEVYING